MHYRLAVPEDAPALLQIYSEYIHSTITFEYTLPTTEEFAERIRAIAGFYPYLVAEEDGRCMGYAHAHRHMERAAYQWNAELSVYLAKSAVGCGLGGGLYSRLMTLLKAQGVLSVFGCVTSPNPPSDRLHKRMGFKLVGTYLQAGFKNGAWHDVNWYQKMLGVHLDDPKPPVPLSALEENSILEVLTGRHLEF